jgi:hypothetical protein
MLWLPTRSSARREFAAVGPAELRGNSEKPPLHLRSENHNLTRRGLACHPAPAIVCIFIATPFAPLAGYNRRAARKVVPREFLGEDTPAGPRRSD